MTENSHDKRAEAPRGWRARTASWRSDMSHRAVAQRAAGSAFLIRVFNAGLGFVTQILFARWMGEYEYGIYAYTWVWVLLLGGISTLGIASVTQRFIPEYTEAGDRDGLRGFLVGAPLLVMGLALILALMGCLFLVSVGSPSTQVPVFLLVAALLCLPAYALSDLQDAIARSYNWINLALMPVYVFRPILIILLVAFMLALGLPANAVWVVAASVIAIVVTSFGQTAVLVARLKDVIRSGPRRYNPRHWMKVALPIFMIDGFYLSLTYIDVLILEHFATPEEVAVYYASTKVMALGALIYFAVSAATAHRFTEYAAAGNRKQLTTFLADSVRWTFWPTLVVVMGLIILGKPFLWLFGEVFTVGYILLPILGIGLLARASVGPCERLLSMLGEQNRTAMVYGGVFLFNLVMNFVLVPSFGMVGSAIATASALIAESALLFVLAKKRLGLHPFVFGGRAAAHILPPAEHLRVEERDAASMEGDTEAWRDLVVRAVEPNGFYDPDFALAAARHLPGGDRVRFILVWNGDQLDALVPVAPVRRRYILPLPLVSVWPAYAPLSTPLLDRDRGAAAFRVALDHLATRARSCLIPRVSDAGGAAQQMRQAIEARGCRLQTFDTHGRALLTIGGDPVGRIKDLVTSKKAKELARLRRRLAELGPIAIETASERTAVMDALERFLALEASGWKGRHGTALANDAGRSAFVREAFAALALRGRAEVVLMRVGDQDVAGGLVLRQSGRAFYFKTAYNEEAARFSPGMILSLALTGMFLADQRLVDVDSVADADHPMIDHLWRDRLPIADWMVELHPQDSFFDLTGLLEMLWRLARQASHRLRKRDEMPSEQQSAET